MMIYLRTSFKYIIYYYKQNLISGNAHAAAIHLSGTINQFLKLVYLRTYNSQYTFYIMHH